MKNVGFLSFGHWTPSPQSQTRSPADALLQSIELAVAAEEVGADGAYFRVHHFARQLASPFPLLAAAGARTSRIELGTGVIDMRWPRRIPLVMGRYWRKAMTRSARDNLRLSHGKRRGLGAGLRGIKTALLSHKPGGVG